LKSHLYPVSDKQLVLETLRQLPEEASLSEIIEELQTLEAIRKGQEDIAEGRFKSHDEVKALVASWTTK
jgi:predicted transcriptional regulator